MPHPAILLFAAGVLAPLILIPLLASRRLWWGVAGAVLAAAWFPLLQFTDGLSWFAISGAFACLAVQWWDLHKAERAAKKRRAEREPDIRKAEGDDEPWERYAEALDALREQGRVAFDKKTRRFTAGDAALDALIAQSHGAVIAYLDALNDVEVAAAVEDRRGFEAALSVLREASARLRPFADQLEAISAQAA